MKTYDWKTAAQKSLDERWYLIRDAKTCDEMIDLRLHTRCTMCVEAGGPGTSVCANECPMGKTRKENWCSINYDLFTDAIDIDDDFPAAKSAADAVVAELEAIANGVRGARKGTCGGKGVRRQAEKDTG